MLDTGFGLPADPIVAVPTALLRPGFSPRSAGLSEENVRLLIEADRPFPPILVHRPTNRVIDGMHRLQAARRRGIEKVDVTYYDCDEATAFVVAVSANVAHGLPLSLQDRKAAAARILRSHGQWSDRRIAAATGLSDKTVGAIRCGAGAGRGAPDADAEGADVRIGLDGRARSLDAATRRLLIAGLIAEEPDASLRRIAERAGVSPETVRAVKAASVKAASVEAASNRHAESADGRRKAAPRTAGMDPHRCLQVLAGDPALRSSDAGRLLLRTLSTLPAIIQDAEHLVDCVPDHDLLLFQQIAAANAEVWRSLSELAARRTAMPRGSTAAAA